MTIKPYFSILFLIIINLFLLNSIALATQSVNQFRNSYSGSINWNPNNGELTFLSSGSIYLSGRPRFFESVWEVPNEISKIIINPNVRVTGQFHFSSAATVEGKNRNNSVIFGTSERSYTANRANLLAANISTIYAGGNITVNVKNLTSLNPKGFHFTARGNTKLNLDSVRAIDNRGGAGNNSDGYVGGNGSIVKNSYFDTGDDIFKIYFGTTTYINNEVRMIQNAVPIQLGWGEGIDSNAKGIFKGLKISGLSGRGNHSRVMIIHHAGSLQRTIEIDDLVFENPNAAVVSLREPGQRLDLTIKNALIDVKQWSGYSRGRINSRICDNTARQNYFFCRSSNGGNTNNNSNSNNNESPPQNLVRLQIQNSNKCLEVGNFSTVNGGNIQQWNCHNGAQQQWHFIPTNGNFYQIQNALSGKCIDIENWSMANNANVQQYDCYNQGNKLFEITPINGEWFSLKNKHSAKCIDIQGGPTQNGTNAQQWNCTNGGPQRFRFY